MWLRMYGLPDVMKPRYIVPHPVKPVGDTLPKESKPAFRTPHTESYMNVFFVAVDAVQMKCQACRTVDDWQRIGADVTNAFQRVRTCLVDDSKPALRIDHDSASDQIREAGDRRTQERQANRPDDPQRPGQPVDLTHDSGGTCSCLYFTHPRISTN